MHSDEGEKRKREIPMSHSYLLTEVRGVDFDELQRIPGITSSWSNDRGDTVCRDHGTRQLQIGGSIPMLLLLITGIHVTELLVPDFLFFAESLSQEWLFVVSTGVALVSAGCLFPFNFLFNL